MPFGVLYFTQDTSDLYIGTGASSGPAVEAISGASGGTGTVTTVSFTGDGTVLSSVRSAAVTTSGTLTATLATQSANAILAGPTSGGAVAPTFRTLVGADLPTLSANLYMSGVFGTSLGNQQCVQNANEVQVYPFTIIVPSTIKNIGATVATGVAGATFDVGIYDPGGNLKLNMGVVSAAVSSTVISTAPTQGTTTLFPGVYYLAQTCSTTAVKFNMCSQINAALWSIGQTVRGGIAVNTSGATGALPAVLGGLKPFNGGNMWGPMAALFAG